MTGFLLRDLAIFKPKSQEFIPMVGCIVWFSRIKMIFYECGRFVNYNHFLCSDGSFVLELAII